MGASYLLKKKKKWGQASLKYCQQDPPKDLGNLGTPPLHIL
jgi:hypothetical protein